MISRSQAQGEFHQAFDLHVGEISEGSDRVQDLLRRGRTICADVQELPRAPNPLFIFVQPCDHLLDIHLTHDKFSNDVWGA